MAENCRRIASFDVDHDFVTPGIYLSRQDGDIDTYDLRTRTPNGGHYMDDITMHTVEHLFATYARNSALGDKVIYFGPMGCQTGFYLLMRSPPKEEVLALVKEVLVKILTHEGEVFGASRKECGNYQSLSLMAAKLECAVYLDVLESRAWDFTYPTAFEEDFV